MRDLTWMPAGKTLFLISHESRAYKDFWGIEMPAHVVLERVTITRSDEIYAYNNGYTNETSYIYHDELGRAFYHHIYVDGTGWRLVSRDPDSRGLWEDGLFSTRRYVRDGQPVLAETLEQEMS